MTSPAATILIVDDELQDRKLLEALLRHEGYLTQSAANGEEALASIAERAPDLILLDLMMPGMDGYEMARRLKANPATSNIPIIMITVQDDRSARLAGLDAGAEDFLTKPVDRAELWLRVRNLLRLKSFNDFLKDHGSLLEQEVHTRTADLRASERRFSDVLQNVELISLMLDTEAQITYCNEYLLGLTGWRREDVIGPKLVRAFHTARNQRPERCFRGAPRRQARSAASRERDPHALGRAPAHPLAQFGAALRSRRCDRNGEHRRGHHRAEAGRDRDQAPEPRLRGVSGTVFLDRVKDLHPDTFRIVLSDRTDTEAIVHAINRGAVHRFYTKPWDDKILRDNVREAFRDYSLLHDFPQLGAEVREPVRHTEAA